MTGIYNGFIGQYEQTATNIFNQMIEVSACEVCASNASLK